MYRRAKYQVRNTLGLLHQASSSSLSTEHIHNSINNILAAPNSVILEHETSIKYQDKELIVSDNNFDAYNLTDNPDTICIDVNDDSNNKSESTLDCLKSELRNWAVSNNVPRITTTRLLSILKSFFPGLPADSRTLLHTPSKCKLKRLYNGDYVYLGLKNGIYNSLETFDDVLYFPDKILQLTFNIDGIPLFHSSAEQFWPILAAITNKTIKKRSPFAVGIFCGKSKPSPLEIYLDDFVNELLELLSNGFMFRGQNFKIEIDKFTCDAPARAFIRCVKSHGGYSSCDKCVETGEYVDHRVILRGTSATRRTDMSFNEQLDEDYHMGVTPLTRLPVGLVSQFPNDYMHSVCLGVMRKLLNTWISGPLTVRLRSRNTKLISEQLLSLKKYIPTEINRKPRELTELSRWKATELRTFLLYLGPVVLKNILPIALYEHYLLLHCGITILCNQKYITKFGIDLANDILTVFVNHCEKIYGKSFYVYNIHSMCHLSSDAEKYGPLDTFSAFCFENYLGQLKKLIRKPNQPLQQVYRRLKEEQNKFVNSTCRDNPKFLLEHYSGPTLRNTKVLNQYKKMIYKEFSLTIYNFSVADCYCLSKNGILIEIHNLGVTDGSIPVVIGKRFRFYDNFFKYPVDSGELNIFFVKYLSPEIEAWHLSDITTKCILFPNDDLFICFPLLHTV